ncbi:RNA pyrophosphohydrolase [Rhodobacterales bacterium 52_120_T64]|nr:RNA pyrophosphohydrolase [Rhodobacterales bacterium 52_120_T64]
MTEEELEALPYRPNVGLMVLNAQGKVFTGQRLDSPGAAWQMPQGGIDEGEDAEVAAYRELREETGIAPEMVQILAQSSDWITYDFPVELAKKLWKGGYRGQKQRWFLMRFTGLDGQINITTDEPEFSEWRWMSPDELLDNIVPFKRSVYEQVLEEFREYLR